MVNLVSFYWRNNMFLSKDTSDPIKLHMVILEIKITVFACLLSNELCDSFVKHLNLELAPNKTNEGVKKQRNIQ